MSKHTRHLIHRRYCIDTLQSMMDISSMRWSSVPAALWVLAWVPSVASSSSWLSYKTTKAAPSFVSSSAGYVKRQQPWATTTRTSSRLASTSRPALTCSLDDLRAAQRDAGGVVGDVSYDEGDVFSLLLGVRLTALTRIVAVYQLYTHQEHVASTATVLGGNIRNVYVLVLNPKRSLHFRPKTVHACPRSAAYL